MTARLGRREALFSLGALSVAACTRRRGDEASLEILASSDASSLDPRFVVDVTSLRISRLVHAALVAPDADSLVPTGWLASALDDEDDGAIVATLREDARFHDGSAITAVDVVASLRALADPALGAPAARIVRTFATVEALDRRRVRIVPDRPRATLRMDLDMPILKADQAAAPRGLRPVGSGPYRIASADEGNIALVPSDAYFGDRARRSLVVRTVRDEAARALRILAGASDVAPNVLPPPLALAIPDRADAPAGLTAVHRPSPSTTLLVPNLDRPPLDRPEVRAAIAASIDRGLLVRAKLGGAGQVAETFVPPIADLFPHDSPARAFDPAAAREILGPLGRSGVRLTLDVAAQRARVGLARAIAQMIGDAGLPCEVRSWELATFLSRLGGGDFDLCIQVAVEIDDPEVMRWYVHGGAIPPNGSNRGRIRDAEVDALLDEGVRTFGREQRRAIYARLERRIFEQAFLIPLHHEDHVAVVSARARGFTPSADGRWGSIASVGSRS